MARHRLTLSISPELKHALDELNDATGVAAASFVGGILEGQAQTFLGIAQAIHKANAEPARKLEIIQAALSQGIETVNEIQLDFLDAQSKLRTYNRKDGDE
ncbi:hypothetical protein [Pseudomonas aeruginosa]|uniref:hypothetical protein n=1 Tax=Pseudomonas aeruginosa TaxID=287 RepID=UPI00053D3FCC|nr:hypothetical protein [Pseudomonas aeruginosa]